MMNCRVELFSNLFSILHTLLKLDKAKQEAKSKDEDLQKLEDRVGSLELQVKSKDQFCKSQQEKVNELESQLGLKTEVCSKVERELLQLGEQVRYKEKTLFTLQQKVFFYWPVTVIQIHKNE